MPSKRKKKKQKKKKERMTPEQYKLHGIQIFTGICKEVARIVDAYSVPEYPYYYNSKKEVCMKIPNIAFYNINRIRYSSRVTASITRTHEKYYYIYYKGWKRYITQKTNDSDCLLLSYYEKSGNILSLHFTLPNRSTIRIKYTNNIPYVAVIRAAWKHPIQGDQPENEIVVDPDRIQDIISKWDYEIDKSVEADILSTIDYMISVKPK
jgi:hypothetical protein